MNGWKRTTGALLLALPAAFTGNALAERYNAFEVTITNITGGEIFTPIMVASHRAGMRLFELGSPASLELEMLAEGGDTGPLGDRLLDEGALDVASSGNVLPPGHSVSVQVRTDRHHDHISLASMMVPSNDAFIAVNGIRGPKRQRTVSTLSPAYDAGTEDNDELCVSIPGPPFTCIGEGFNAATGEGYVYIHPGIQGIGDLVAADLAWHNPVARITIRRVRIDD